MKICIMFMLILMLYGLIMFIWERKTQSKLEPYCISISDQQNASKNIIDQYF